MSIVPIPESMIYDCKRPVVFTAQQMEEIQNNLITDLARSFLIMFRKNEDRDISVAINLPERRLLSEYINYGKAIVGKSAPAYYATANCKDSYSEAIIKLPFALCNILLSESANPYKPEEETKNSLTQEQATILARLINEWLNDWNAKCIQIKGNRIWRTASFQKNPGYTLSVTPEENVLMIVLDINLEDSSYSVEIVLPFLTLETLLLKRGDHKNRMRANKSSSKAVQSPLELNNHSNQSQVEITVELCRMHIAATNVANLLSGKALTFTRDMGDPIDLVVRDRVIARGELLIMEEKLAIRVTDKLYQSDKSENDTQPVCYEIIEKNHPDQTEILAGRVIIGRTTISVLELEKLLKEEAILPLPHAENVPFMLQLEDGRQIPVRTGVREDAMLFLRAPPGLH